MVLSKNLLKMAAALSGCALPAAALHADTIAQTVNPPSNGVSWNDSYMWGSAPTAGNDYRSSAGTGATTLYTINGIAWTQGSQSVTDTTIPDAATSTTFNGDHLIITSNSALNAKAGDGGAYTVNLVFDGGSYRGNYGSSTASSSSTLNGTVSFASGTTIGAFGVGASISSSTNISFTLSSAIVGGAGNTLQLAMNGGVNKQVLFNVNGDLSGFFGTLYLGVDTSGLQTGTGTTSAFSISSDAQFATVQFDTTTTNFHYDLGGADVTFGNAVYGNGTGTSIAPGTYNADDLNALTSSSAFLGDGTITVVPEPNIIVLGGLALLFLVIFRRRTALI